MPIAMSPSHKGNNCFIIPKFEKSFCVLLNLMNNQVFTVLKLSADLKTSNEVHCVNDSGAIKIHN